MKLSKVSSVFFIILLKKNTKHLVNTDFKNSFQILSKKYALCFIANFEIYSKHRFYI